jgi:hypothetical protein
MIAIAGRELKSNQVGCRGLKRLKEGIEFCRTVRDGWVNDSICGQADGLPSRTRNPSANHEHLASTRNSSTKLTTSNHQQPPIEPSTLPPPNRSSHSHNAAQEPQHPRLHRPNHIRTLATHEQQILLRCARHTRRRMEQIRQEHAAADQAARRVHGVFGRGGRAAVCLCGVGW